MIFDSSFMGASQKSIDAAITTYLKGRLFYLKITIPTLRDISNPTNWNGYKFFSLTQKVLEIDGMVYNITKNLEIY